MAEIKLISFRTKDEREISIRSGVEDDAPGLLSVVDKYVADGEGQILVPASSG